MAVKFGNLRKTDEQRLEAFEMKGLRQILRLFWMTKQMNEWVLQQTNA